MALQRLMILPLLLCCAAIAAQQATVAAQQQATVTGMRVFQAPTVLGVKFGQCFNSMIKNVAPRGAVMYDIRANHTMAPLGSTLEVNLAEAVAAQMTEQQVDDFCRAVGSPVLVAAMKQQATGRRQASSTAAAAAAAAQQNKQKGAARPADFTTPFTSDKASSIFLPHDAEYAPGTGAYDAVMAPLIAAGIYPDNSGTARSDTVAVAEATIACAAIEIANFVVSVVCGLTGTTGVWAGVGGGVWSAPAEIACLAAQSVSEAAFKICNDVVTFAGFVDGNVDGSELQAAYENGKKAMDNQLTLWNKINDAGDTTNQLINDSTDELSTAVQRSTNQMRTAVADSTKALTARVQESTDAIIADLHATVDAAVAQLSAQIQQTLTTLASQVCDLKTDVANVQREADYVRRLLLTPDKLRPGFNCDGLTATLNKKSHCEVKCPMTPPNACTSLNTSPFPVRINKPMPPCF